MKHDILVDDDPKKLLQWKPWTPPTTPVHAGPTKELRILHEESNRWEEPVEALRAADGTSSEDHQWWLAGTKSDHVAPVTYFLWGCRKCGRRVVTETPSKDAPHFADQCPPSKQDLSRAGIDEDCRQALVDGVHAL